ncbi:MAG: putative two-component system sensor kinase [Frankiales bacterium]|nr:putative two-component system sensor kinase [Frankiales bacterium]
MTGPRLVRPSTGRALGGVAAGVAAHLGVPVLAVRGAFVVLAVSGGFGVVLYAAFWLVLPQDTAPAAAPRPVGQLVALAALGIGAVLLLPSPLRAVPLLPLLAVLAGVVLVWQQADAAQRTRFLGAARGRSLLVVLAGAVLLVVGLAGFLASRGDLGAARDGLLSTVLAVVGLVVLSGPWWLRMTSDLRAERRERIRSQERAEVAAHVHDSVLQTLALIRKAADDPREVARLARTQERELRGWLYAPVSSPVAFAAALERVVADVEEQHGIAVETVVVGDAPPDDGLLAVVAAAREALVNAARHAGVTTVSLYAEVGADGVEVFVRDRGTGFDPALVPADRHGVRGSIVERMTRHGGSAVVRSAPGEGTEVRLALPLTAPQVPRG